MPEVTQLIRGILRDGFRVVSQAHVSLVRVMMKIIEITTVY